MGADARTTPPGRRAGIVIICDECVKQCTPTCDDCVVTYVLRADDEAPAPLTLDVAEERVVRLLEQAGLIPALKYQVAV
jgi:hypothetical protein